MLDATAGNRMIWPNKHPPNVVFMDKEFSLDFPPHIFGDFRHPPFREDVFDCVLFDPPHSWTMPPWMLDPKRRKRKEFKKHNPKYKDSARSWYGVFKSKRDLLSSINEAQKAFSRLAPRLCLKWSELSVSLWKILPFFTKWKRVHTLERKSKYARLPHFWVTFINSELCANSE